MKPKVINNCSRITCDGAISGVMYVCILNTYRLDVGAGGCDSYTQVISYYSATGLKREFLFFWYVSAVLFISL